MVVGSVVISIWPSPAKRLESRSRPRRVAAGDFDPIRALEVENIDDEGCASYSGHASVADGSYRSLSSQHSIATVETDKLARFVRRLAAVHDDDDDGDGSGDHVVPQSSALPLSPMTAPTRGSCGSAGSSAPASASAANARDRNYRVFPPTDPDVLHLREAPVYTPSSPVPQTDPSSPSYRASSAAAMSPAEAAAARFRRASLTPARLQSGVDKHIQRCTMIRLAKEAKDLPDEARARRARATSRWLARADNLKREKEEAEASEDRILSLREQLALETAAADELQRAADAHKSTPEGARAATLRASMKGRALWKGMRGGIRQGAMVKAIIAPGRHLKSHRAAVAATAARLEETPQS